MVKQTVGLLGASGETGTSILNGLLDDRSFNIIAYARPSSVSKPANTRLKDVGVELRTLDLSTDDHATIVATLGSVDILISAIGPQAQLDQIPLATAAKQAGVKRFVPCAFVTVMPVGVHLLRDQKEEVYNHMKRLALPFTIIDVGWWYQISFPRLPSGKIDYAVGIPDQPIAGDGNQLSALTDLRDIGRYVTRVINDERTLNQQVLVYNEMWSQNQVYDVLEKMSGEHLDRKYASGDELESTIEKAKKAATENPSDFMTMINLVGSQYMLSWGVRGDNTPQYAKYLGYLTSKELYPDFEGCKFEDYLREVVDGKAKGVYEDLKAMMATMGKNDKH